MAKCICAEASERRKLWAAAGSAAQCGTHRRLGRSADSLAARLRLGLASLLRRQFAEIRRPAQSRSVGQESRCNCTLCNCTFLNKQLF